MKLNIVNGKIVPRAGQNSGLEQLGQLLRGSLYVHLNYVIQVGEKKSKQPVVYREGVARGEFKGRMGSAWRTKPNKDPNKDQVICISGRNINRINPGDRRDNTDEDLARAEKDHRMFKNLRGEFQYRTLHLKGVTWMRVCYAGKWYEVNVPAWQEFIDTTRVLEPAKPEPRTGPAPSNPRKAARKAARRGKRKTGLKRLKFADWFVIIIGRLAS